MAEEQFVEIREPGKAPRRVVLEGTVEIGRECEGELVEDTEVSRRHLKLVPSPTGLKVVDLGSSNGTMVNGVKITEPTVLHVGDIVRLGKVEVMVGSPPVAPAPVRATVAPSAGTRTTTTTAMPAVGPTTAKPAMPAPSSRPVPPVAPAPAAAKKVPVVVSVDDVKSRPLSVVTAVAGRILHSIVHQPWTFIRNVVVGGFFLVVLTAALKQVESNVLELKAASIVFPLGVVLAATGISRASMVAEDIQRGLFDRLLLSGSRRLPVLVGCLIADFVVAAVATLPLIVVGLALGLSFGVGPGGIGGIAIIVVLAATWAAAYGSIWYAVAFRTANPTYARLGYQVLFPLAFFSPVLVPKSLMAGWLSGATRVNPLSYVVEAIRALQVGSSYGGALIKAAIAIVVVGAIGIVLAWRAVRAQVVKTMGGRQPRPPKAKSAAPAAEAAAASAQSEADMLRAALEAERQARKRAEDQLAAGGK